MTRLIGCCILAFLVCGFSVDAREIKLKNTFFGGWKYSVDGGDFHKVGWTGKTLRLEMEDNPESVKLIDSYRKYNLAGQIIGIPGGFLVGWAAGSAIAGRYKDSDKTLLTIGAPLCATSIVLELVANGKLKKAIKTYNDPAPAVTLRTDVQMRTVNGHATGFAVLALGF